MRREGRKERDSREGKGWVKGSEVVGRRFGDCSPRNFPMRMSVMNPGT